LQQIFLSFKVEADTLEAFLSNILTNNFGGRSGGRDDVDDDDDEIDDSDIYRRKAKIINFNCILPQIVVIKLSIIHLNLFVFQKILIHFALKKIGSNFFIFSGRYLRDTMGNSVFFFNYFGSIFKQPRPGHRR